MKAFLKNNRQAPRKVRLVARAMVGKNVSVALSELSFMPQKSAASLKKLIASAYANARQSNDALREEDLVVKNITVDQGVTYVRYMPRAFGRAAPINRECSHVHVTLAPVHGAPTAKVVAEKKVQEKEEVKKKVKAKKTAPAPKKEAKKKVTK